MPSKKPAPSKSAAAAPPSKKSTKGACGQACGNDGGGRPWPHMATRRSNEVVHGAGGFRCLKQRRKNRDPRPETRKPIRNRGTCLLLISIIFLLIGKRRHTPSSLSLLPLFLWLCIDTRVAKPKAEMQWYKGSQKIKEGAKFAVKYNTLSSDEYEIMLEISVSTNLVNRR